MSKGRIPWLIGAVLATGCADEGATTPPETTTIPEEGACGDVSEMDLVIVGSVEDRAGAVVGGATVSLEERNWAPGTVHGQARSGADGRFELAAHGLPVVEGCWGTAVQFWLVGEAAGLWGDKPMNTQVIGAWNDGAGTVDLGAFPLVLD